MGVDHGRRGTPLNRVVSGETLPGERRQPPAKLLRQLGPRGSAPAAARHGDFTDSDVDVAYAASRRMRTVAW